MTTWNSDASDDGPAVAGFEASPFFSEPPRWRPPVARPPWDRPPSGRPPVARPPWDRPPWGRPPVPRPPWGRPPFGPIDSTHLPNDFDFDSALKVAAQIHRYRKKVTAEQLEEYAPARDRMLASWIGPLGDDMRTRAERNDGRWNQSMGGLRKLSKQLVDRWVDEVDDYNRRAYKWALNQPNILRGHAYLAASPLTEIASSVSNSPSDFTDGYLPWQPSQPEPPQPVARPTNFTPDRPPFAVYARRGRYWSVEYVWKAPNPPLSIGVIQPWRPSRPPGWHPIPREEIVAELPQVRSVQSEYAINLSEVLDYLAICRRNFWFIRWWGKACKLEAAACEFADGTIDPHGVFDELKDAIRDMRFFRRLAARTYWRLEGPPPWWEPKPQPQPPIFDLPICDGVHPRPDIPIAITPVVDVEPTIAAVGWVGQTEAVAWDAEPNVVGTPIATWGQGLLEETPIDAAVPVTSAEVLADGTTVLPDGTKILPDGTQINPDGSTIAAGSTVLTPAPAPAPIAATDPQVPPTDASYGFGDEPVAQQPVAPPATAVTPVTPPPPPPVTDPLSINFPIPAADPQTSSPTVAAIFGDVDEVHNDGTGTVVLGDGTLIAPTGQVVPNLAI